MGDPYVNSGELFIRTTGRVSVNVALYDMILTTQHLILVDNTYARFEPQMIPVLTVLSVTAGKVATGEPVITLTFTATGSTGAPAPMNLIFSQQPGEQRKRERDEWIKLLIDHIVAARHKDIHADAAPAHAERDRFPPGATPRPIEPVFPRKTRSGPEPFPSEIVILPDEIESPEGEDESIVLSPAATPPGPAPSPVKTEKGLAGPVTKTTLLPGMETLPGPTGKEPTAAEGGDHGSQDSFALTIQTAIKSLGTVAPAAPPIAEPKDQPVEETTPHAPGSSPPSREPRSWQTTVLAISILVIIILAVMGWTMLNVPVEPQKGEGPLVPVVTTTPSLPGISALVTIPGNGVWVRVEYNGSFIGYVGNPGSLQHVGGSGDRFYYIPKSDDLAQASFMKQDNSGNPLTVEVYRNGEMVLHRTTRAPKGEVQVLIDPRTGNPPGINTPSTP